MTAVAKKNKSTVDLCPPFVGEPECASMKTAVPGPKTEELRLRHGRWQDSRTVHYYQDTKRSLGNYAVDVDDNVFLDLYGHIACLPIGYNHPDMLAAWKGGRFDWVAGFRPSLGMAAPPEWVDLVENVLGKVAPKGHQKVFTVTTGAEAVENALKAAFVWKMRKRRKGATWTAEDASLAMLNRQPGVNNLKVISFEGGFHGRSLGALSATRSKPIHKVDFPAFDWPVVPFPANRAATGEFASQNAEAEAKSLQSVHDILFQDADNVAALIVEPIQGEGGDRHASPAFFQSLRKMCTEYEVAFIADEVQTGMGATGTFWAHEQWGLDRPPDLVTWSKKFQLGGVYMTDELMPAESYRIFNTWLGDPLRLAQAQVILEVIERDKLIEHTARVGVYLLERLQELGKLHPGVYSEARGKGTFAAIDVRDTPTRDKILVALRQRGVEAGGSGERSIRFRPALVFMQRHVDEAIDALDEVGEANR